MDYIKLLINIYFYISVKLVETQVLHTVLGKNSNENNYLHKVYIF